MTESRRRFAVRLSAYDLQACAQRVRDWFAAVERYPRQLHEIEQSDYLEMKRHEYLRQQTG